MSLVITHLPLTARDLRFTQGAGRRGAVVNELNVAAEFFAVGFFAMGGVALGLAALTCRLRLATGLASVFLTGAILAAATPHTSGHWLPAPWLVRWCLRLVAS